ncbi:MAG: ABC transporter ATP-binding protein [bacterium]|jgi:peptide/nickel transport system ATP-binding protein
MTILSINNLSLSFKNDQGIHKALKPISFTIKRGQVCGIVGESGSGKSITSLAIMGLLSKNAIIEGEIIYYDQNQTINLLSLSDNELRSYRGNKFAMIFQEPMTSLNPVMKCGEQVLEAILNNQNISEYDAKQKVIALFNEVQLPRPEKIYNAYPHEISGGQKQRVMIAMALSSNPELLIADEPTTALDVTVQKNIIELLKKIKNERAMSMIFISHDLGLVAEIADEVLVMNKGELVEQNTSVEIFRHPKNNYTKGLIACKPNIHQQMKRLLTINDFVNEETPIAEILNKQTLSESEILSRRKSIENSEVILEVKNLSKYYNINTGLFTVSKDKVYAVNDVSFKIYKGETLGLVGESGCGKTTLGRSILRLIEPDEGEILFKSDNILKYNTKELRAIRSKIQIIFQDPYSSLNPKMTIGQALMEPMMIHKIGKTEINRKKIVLDTLENVGLLPEHFNRYPHEFSGGQRQRICIARTLVLQPELIICDESVSALDVSVQAQVLNLLADLRDKFSLTYLFISHDLSVIKHISDRIMVMQKGKIVESGYPDLVYANPQQEYTKELIASIPDWN